MAEITDKKRENEGQEAKDAMEVVHVETGPVEADLLEGFTSEECERMLKVKGDIARGRYSDLTAEYRKLLFVQWLIEHDRLKS